MKSYSLPFINQEGFLKNVATLFQTITGTEAVATQSIDPEKWQPGFIYARLQTDQYWQVFLMGKPGAISTSTMIKHYHERLIASDSPGGYFLGYILLINTRHSSKEIEAKGSHPMVERARDIDIPVLRNLAPDSPFIIASFGHEKENAMSVERLNATLNLPEHNPIIPIDLNSKADGMKLIHTLFALNGITAPGK